MKYEIDLYKIDEKNLHRFYLGKISEKTLFVFGVNPSTANDQEPDRTIKRVMGFAEDNGYNSFVMFNLYPRRSTKPNELPEEVDEQILYQNVSAIYDILMKVDNPHILLAWGGVIYKRAYLSESLKLIYSKLSELNITWLRIGEILKCNQPRASLIC